MKKIYTTILVFIFSFSMNAQLSNQQHNEWKGKKSNKEYAINNNKSAPFWSEDFANGIPTTWTNAPSFGPPWVYRGPSTTPSSATGSQGAYSGSSSPINSVSANNGFIIFDSDYYDNGGTPGAFGTGMYPTPHNGELMTDMIDLTNYSDVTLVATSYFRTFQGQAFVAFYVNGVYDSQVEVHSDLAVNEGTALDETILVRFPLTVCGNPNVQMKFLFDGSTNSNTNGSGYYFWMLDDLELIETPPYLMDIVDQNHGGWDIGYANTVGVGMDYTMKPKIQSDANPYMFEATLANLGANDLTNISMNVEVRDMTGNVVFTGSSTPTTLSVLDTSAYLATQTYAPANVGMYEMDFWGSSDSTMSDIITMQAIINDSVYARDYNDAGGSWRVARDCGGLQLGNKFDVYAADELTSVSAYLTDFSVVGTPMFGVVYEVDTFGGTTTYLQLAQTDDYTIQPSDRDNWVTIGFNSPVSLASAGPKQYMIAIGGYPHPLDTFGINTSGSAEVTMSMIQDNGCNLGSQAFGYWYWISTTPMIRMNFGEVVINSNEDLPKTSLIIYPNPARSELYIQSDNIKNDQFIIEIVDMVGRTLYYDVKEVFGTLNETIDVSNFSKGTYLLNIKNSSTVSTKKISIE